MNKVRIAGAIASQTGITLYLENGAEMNLPRDSWRTRAILDEALGPLARHEIVELDLDKFSIERRIEKKTNGLVRFFRKVGEALGFTHTGGVGEQPASPGEVEAPLVAVVNGKEISGVQELEKQMERAIRDDNVIGFQRFLERIAAVIDDRGHTVDELLNFMKRADLPIADDGSIVAYKVLTTKIGEPDDLFFDCHTKSVPQRLGSRVWMSKSLVNPSRRTECSTGLHIARRGYLRYFSGDVITLVKIAPEDVICVPSGEPDKMRVAEYHIVQVLPKEAHSLLRSNQPMTSNKVASQMLADVIAGNHIGIVEHVNIGGPMGTKIFVGKVNAEDEKAPALGSDIAKALDDPNAVSKPVDVKEVRKAVDDAVADKKREERNRKRRERRAAAKQVVEQKVTEKIAKPKKTVAKEPADDLPAKHREALKMLADGKSRREVERTLHICRKTLKKLVDKHG